MTVQERQAIGFLLAVTLLGTGVRVARARADRVAAPTADSLALARQLSAVDSALDHRTRSGKKSRARSSRSKEAERTDDRQESPRSSTPDITAVPEIRGASTRASAGSAKAIRVDLDVASQEEIERLPYVGPSLASRIIEHRERCGPFGSLEELERVRGIGTRTARRLAEHVTFSGTSRGSCAR